MNRMTMQFPMTMRRDEVCRASAPRRLERASAPKRAARRVVK
jgi:hypothetical protein